MRWYLLSFKFSDESADSVAAIPADAIPDNASGDVSADADTDGDHKRHEPLLARAALNDVIAGGGHRVAGILHDDRRQPVICCRRRGSSFDPRCGLECFEVDVNLLPGDYAGCGSGGKVDAAVGPGHHPQHDAQKNELKGGLQQK